MNDLVPSESRAQPAGSGDNSSLAAGVVYGLARMVLTVQLQEQAQRRPGQINEGDEVAMAILDAQLPLWLAETRNGASQLEREGLEEAP